MRLPWEDRGETNAWKKSSTSLTARELAIKTAVKHHLTPARSTIAEETKQQQTACEVANLLAIMKNSEKK